MVLYKEKVNKIVSNIKPFILVIICLFGILIVSCSSVTTVQKEQLNSSLPDGKITHFITKSGIFGYYLDTSEFISFNSNRGSYDNKAHTISGTLDDGTFVKIHVDSLIAIKLKKINKINGITLKPEQFKREIQKKPSKYYNPCWDFVKVKSDQTKINIAKQNIEGITINGNKFELPLVDVYEVRIEKKNKYKKLNFILTVVGLYALAYEARDIFD